MTELTATVFDIQRNSFVDGPGIRTAVFLKGCNLSCAWCHNPEGQHAAPQWMLYPERCVGCGRCADVTLGSTDFRCPHAAKEICGRAYSADELLGIIQRDNMFYGYSGGGVTFSGGECMLQIDFLRQILQACKAAGIHTAVDTAGHVPFACFEKILPYTDLFLYDIKCYDSDRHRQYTGVSNELIFSNLEKLLKTGKAVWIRIPVIPTVNDTVEEMQDIKRMLDRFGSPERVELLPYHAMGSHKYAAIGAEAQCFTPPTAEAMEQLRAVFS